MKPDVRKPALHATLAPRFAAAFLAVAAVLLPTPVRAQEALSADPTEMTVLSSPPDARVILRGSSEVGGFSPLDLGPQWFGRYSVTIDAPGYATARGALSFPQRGLRPTSPSEPPGISGALLLRSLNFPGLPDLLSGNMERGAGLLLAGAGGAGAVLRDHLEYRSNLKKPDVESQDRAYDFHYARGRWALYTGAVWGMSALDYILRPRMQLLESTPTRVTIGAPKLTRAGVMWRSVLVPGAGQEYANQRVRGILWLGATLVSGAAYFTADESHHRILTKLGRAEALLATASPAEITDRQADVDHFSSREETSKKLLHGLGLGTVGIYVANIVDAGIVQLGRPSGANRKFSLAAPVNPHRLEIALTHRF